MRKVILIIVFLIFQTNLIFSQFTDFISDTVFLRDTTTLISNSFSPDEIISFDWDLNYDSLFNNASGDTVKWVFPNWGDNIAGLRITTNTGHKDSVYKIVFVKYKPAPIIVDFKSNFVCYQDSTTLISTSISELEITNIDWDLNADGIFNNASGDTIKYVFPKWGENTAGLRIITITGETDSIYKIVNVGFFPDSVIADFKYDTVCYHDTTTLISTSISGDEITSLEWDLNADGVFDNASGDTIEYIFPKMDENTIGIRAITNTGKSAAFYKQVNVHYLPEPDFIWDHPCESEETFFFNKSTIKEGSITDFKWDFGDITEEVFEENPIHIFDYVSTFNVKLALTSNMGCKDSTYKGVLIHSVPIINIEFSGDTTLFVGDSLMMRVYGSYDSIVWSNGQKRNRIYVKTTGIYTVTVYSKGCFKSRSVNVLVKERSPLEAMNLITPNGDGYNDKWEIFEIDQYHPCQVTIFNRYGVPVFASFYYKNDWDASFDGKPLPEGTYYYLIITGTMLEFTGAINVIR